MTAETTPPIEATLSFDIVEEVSSTTFIYQTDNGKIFFRQNDLLWTQHNGQKVKAKPIGFFNYSVMAVQGNALYYGSMWKRKIYKAEFTDSMNSDGEIISDLLRVMEEGENIHQGGMCSIVRDSEIYIYRMCEAEPKKVQLNAKVTEDVMKNQELRGIFGNTAIFRQIVIEPVRPAVKRTGDNAITLVCYRGMQRRLFEKLDVINDMIEFNASWGSPAIVKSDFVYMTNGNSLFVLDPVKADILPPLKFADVSAFHIAGIHDGILYGRGKCEKKGKYYLMTASLPSEYVDKPFTESTEANSEIFLSDFIKRFTVKRVIGEGGFGCVLEVINKHDKGQYAVKRIAVRPFQMAKALGEAQVMAQLSRNHPGIVGYNTSWPEEPPEGWQHERDAQLLKEMGSSKRFLGNYSEDSAFIYIQMELCNHSLFDWLRDNQEQSSRSLMRMKSWFKQMVSAVAYIHASNVIHRDLKPHNILFADSDTIKLCDFGIATVRNNEEDTFRSAVARTIVGTRTYMSPEQQSGKPYGSPTDVFTLGLMLAEMCLAMKEDERSEIFDNYRRGVQCDRIVDEKTKEFIEWLTKAEPEDRPSCRDMLNQLYMP